MFAKDRKTLYVVRGGRFLSINSDDAQLATFEGRFEAEGVAVEEKKSEDGSVNQSSEEVVTIKNTNNQTTTSTSSTAGGPQNAGKI